MISIHGAAAFALFKGFVPYAAPASAPPALSYLACLSHNLYALNPALGQLNLHEKQQKQQQQQAA